MGTCLSKKKGSSTTTTLAETKSSTTTTVLFEWKNNSSQNGVTKPKIETQTEVNLKKENSKKAPQKHDCSVQEHKGQAKKEIFIIKHRKSHDANTESGELMGVRTSSVTKDDVDAILIHCGRLSRNSSVGEHRRRFSGSKKSNDFDNFDNDLKASDLHEDDWKEPAEKMILQSPRSTSQDRNRNRVRRRRTPSREREQQQQCSSSRERRFSISPVRRSSDTTTTINARNKNIKPAKMVSVPATVSSLVMGKSNDNGCEGGESTTATTGIKRITVRRNVGAASPRSQSPARANGNAANQPSLSRNSSRKAEESPYRRNPLNELEPNTFPIPHATTNDNSSRLENISKKEAEFEANKKPNVSRIELDKGEDLSYKPKLQQEEDVKVISSITDNVVVKTEVPQGVENHKPQTLSRSRSLRRSRDLELDLNHEALSIPPQSYTSLLLEDIQNFHQKNTQPPPFSLPACVTRACSIVEAVANLNSNNSSNLSGVEDRRNPPSYQSSRNEYSVPLGSRKDPIVESELLVYDDMVESSLHKYVTVNRGGSDMDDQEESSGSNNLTVSSAKQRHGISSSSWEPSSTDSKDRWTARLNNCKEEDLKGPLRSQRRVSSVAGRANLDGAKKKLNSKKRECDRQHHDESGRGRLGANNVHHMKPVVTAAAVT